MKILMKMASELIIKENNAITTQRNRKNELRQPQQNTMEAL
jgi:hypothetical protein